jgi:hypothetical protein
MFENDPDLLLKLAACCKILLAGTVDLQALPRAQQLLEDYLAGFLKVCRPLVFFFWADFFGRIIRIL